MGEIKNGYQPIAKPLKGKLIPPNCGSHVFEPEAQRKLTKAEEIIEKLLNAFASNDFFEEEELNAMAEAEQFLKEE